MAPTEFGPCAEGIVTAAEAGEPGALLALVGINTAYAGGVELPHDIASWMPVVICPLRRCGRQILVCIQSSGDVERVALTQPTKTCLRNNALAETI